MAYGKAFAALIAVRKEMSPFFNFPKDETVAAKEARRKKINKLNESLKAKKTLLLNWPRRLTSCSVALLLARCEPNGTEP
jgi:hypothetical protein